MKTWLITGASRGFGALIMKVALASDAIVATARDPIILGCSSCRWT